MYEIIAPTHSELDLSDTQSVDDYFKNKSFDVVLHSATKPGHRNAKDLINLFYTNVRMFENLERHKDKFDKFINFGSGAIYDVSANNSGVTEEDIYKNLGKDDHSFCKYVVHKQIDHLDNFIDLNMRPYCTNLRFYILLLLIFAKKMKYTIQQFLICLNQE